MRCNNCGFPNRPEETECVKCHTPLDSRSDSMYRHSGIRQDINATVPEGNYFIDSEGRVCPKCGYPLRDNSNRCPNCNYTIASMGVHQKNFRSYRQERMDNPARENKNVMGTINPFRMEVESEPGFVLRPIIRQNEKKDVSDLTYEGKEVLLNRSNTEADNTSITSQSQALLSFKEGHWYIEDKSEQNTTFVRAGNKIELHDGDTLLLGNRLFEFHLPDEN